ncbi:MAG: CARDB domain-containing protein [archaeon]
MESKQILVTVVIALIVALAVSIISIKTISPMSSPTRIYNVTGMRGLTLMPDLTISRFSTTSSGGGGGGGCGNGTNETWYCSKSLFVTIKNIGSVTASQSHVELTVPDGNNTYIDYKNITSLNPGQTIEVQFSSGSHLSGFNYTAYAMADTFNQVNESNENNNFEMLVFDL